MAVTETTYTGNGSTTNYSFTFPYLKTTDIKASIDGTATDDLNDFAIRLFNATTVQFVNNTTDNTPTAPANNAAIRIYRETDDSKLEAEFFAGSAIKSSDLNDNFNQNLYVTQESNNKINTAWTTGDKTIVSTETWVSNDTRVSTTAAQDGRIDAKIDTALTTDVVGGQSITITDNSPGTGQITASVTAGSIRGTELAGDAVDGTKIADDSINSEHIASGAVDLEHMSANSVDSNQYVDGSIDLVHMSANSVDSNQYVDGSIDREHLSADIIDGTKLADSAVNSEHITSGSVDLAHMSANSIDSDQYVDGSIDRVHLSADIIDGTKIADDALSTEHYSNGSITSDKLNAATVVTASEQASATANDTSFFTTSAADARYFNISSGDTIKDGQSFPDNDTTIATTAAINDRIIDLVDDVGGFVPIANETSFPNANPDVNNGTGTLVSIKTLASNLTSNGSGVATIANGTVGNSTVTITGLENSTTYSSGYGMIVETTTTLNTYTFHRLVPKATEVTTVAGKATEIGRLGTAAAVEDLGILGTTDVVADLAILGTNDVVADLAILGSTDVVADMNTLAVTSVINNMDTCATNVSNINNVGGSIANVNTVASNLSGVNSFADRYRVASSAPTSSLDEGDLYFDTTGNELKVYNGSAWQGGVTATGNLVSKSGDQMTGNLSFSGSQTVDGRDVSVDGTKLDGIEAGATADQTNAEIRAAVEAATDSNVFTDADHTKLNAIAAGATNTAAVGGASGVDFNDNVKVRFGTGNDLEVFHDGTDSWLKTPQNIYLQSVSADTVIKAGDDIRLQVQGSETAINCIGDGSVELYYDGSKNFETTSTGVKVTSSGSSHGLRVFHSNGNEVAQLAHGGSGDEGVLSLKDSGTDTVVIRGEVGQDTDITTGANFDLEHDSAKLRLGTGNDLQIYHNGSNSYVSNTTGDLYVRSNANIRLTNTSNETILAGNAGGAVELRYDDSKKFETTANGIKVPDNARLSCGTGEDMYIKHDGSSGYISNGNGPLYIEAKQNETAIQITPDGSTDLRYDGSKKFETTSTGVSVSGNLDVGSVQLSGGGLALSDNDKVICGSGDDLQIYHDSGGKSYVSHTHSGGEELIISSGNDTKLRVANTEEGIIVMSNGAVKLYYDNSLKLSTVANGVHIVGNAYHVDNEKSIYGGGDDLQIYHNGSHSIIDNNTGILYLQSDQLNINNSASDEGLAKFYANGAVKLNYDNVLRFETTSYGNSVHGHFDIAGDNEKLRLGGSYDLELWHDGTSNYISATGGASTNVRAKNLYFYVNANTSSEKAIMCYQNAATDLYYDDSKKLATTSTGIDVTGAITVNGSALSSGQSAGASYALNNVFSHQTYHTLTSNGYQSYGTRHT